MYSMLLVSIQFLMILAIAYLGDPPRTFVPLLLFLTGIILGIASIITMRPGNLRIFPEPKKDIQFITTGPYRFVRHPMYASVLLMTASFLAEPRSPLLYLLWIVLLGVLLGKIHIEEKLLPALLPEYSDYKKRTRKLIPFLF